MLGKATDVSNHVSDGLTGFHMNALFALILVLALMLGILFLVDRLKKFMPRLLHQKTSPSKGTFSVRDVVPLDSKRKLVSVSIESSGGKKALAVLLIGGGSDLCVGWLDETPSHMSCPDPSGDGAGDKAQKNSSHV